MVSLSVISWVIFIPSVIFSCRPGPAYPYPPRQQYDAPPYYPRPSYGPDNYPMYNQNNSPIRPPHMPQNNGYRQNRTQPAPSQQQEYDPSRPTEEDSRGKTVYQSAEVHYEVCICFVNLSLSSASIFIMYY